MRLSARDFHPEIVTAPDSRRPIRLRAGGGMTFMLTPGEAIELATALADAAAELRPPRALEIFNTSPRKETP